MAGNNLTAGHKNTTGRNETTAPDFFILLQVQDPDAQDEIWRSYVAKCKTNSSDGSEECVLIRKPDNGSFVPEKLPKFKVEAIYRDHLPDNQTDQVHRQIHKRSPAYGEHILNGTHGRSRNHTLTGVPGRIAAAKWPDAQQPILGSSAQPAESAPSAGSPMVVAAVAITLLIAVVVVCLRRNKPWKVSESVLRADMTWRNQESGGIEFVRTNSDMVQGSGLATSEGVQVVNTMVDYVWNPLDVLQASEGV